MLPKHLALCWLLFCLALAGRAIADPAPEALASSEGTKQGANEDASQRASLDGNALRPERQENGLLTCTLVLGRDHLRAFYTDQHGVRFGHMKRLIEWLAASHEQLQCATNGGIYAVGGRPLGWLVADGVLLQPINTDNTSTGNFFLQPNGAFILDAAGARIESTQALMRDAPSDVGHIQLALQSGPLLLQHGDINARLEPDSNSRYSRNSICVVDRSHVILAYSERPVTLYRFAEQLQQIGCREALYLDGHLSQMYPSEAALEPAQQRDLSVFIGVTSRTMDEQTVQ